MGHLARPRAGLLLAALAMMLLMLAPSINSIQGLGQPPISKYSRQELLFSDLKTPSILGHDKQGRIYFSDYEDDGWHLKRFDPISLKVEDILVANGSIGIVGFDAQRDIYYAEYVDETKTCVLRELPRGSHTPITIYSAPKGYFISDMDVDPMGNIAFTMSNFFPGESREVYEAYLYVIAAGSRTPILLYKYSSTKRCFIPDVYILHTLRQGIVYTLHNASGNYIYRVLGGRRQLLLYKSSEHNGAIPYITLDSRGDLYYFYRKRSDAMRGVADKWGYMEIGVIRHVLSPHVSVETLYTRYYDDRAIAVWMGTGVGRNFMGTYRNDIFVDFVSWFENGSSVEYLVYLDRITGDLNVLAKGAHYMTFTHDFMGNIYYAKIYLGQPYPEWSGEIWRAYRYP